MNLLNYLRELWRSLNKEYPCDFLDICRVIPFTREEIDNIDFHDLSPIVCPICAKEKHELSGDIPSVFGIFYDEWTEIFTVQHSCGREFILQPDGTLTTR